AAAALALTAALGAQRQPRSIDDFFRDFTAEWIRADPNLATRARYFTGAEQNALERQVTPQTDDFRRARIRLARKGLKELSAFDRAGLSASQQISADLLQWQLEMAVAEEPYLDFSFPLNQMNGVNVNLVEGLTVGRAVATEKDADNYLAALG